MIDALQWILIGVLFLWNMRSNKRLWDLVNTDLRTIDILLEDLGEKGGGEIEKTRLGRWFT